MESADKVVYKVPEIAEILEVSPKSIYELIAQEKLKCVRVGRAIRIPKDYLDEFLNS